MNYIELKLQHIPTNGHHSKDYTTLPEIITHPIIILLGSPGSGKTSLLKKYKETNQSNTNFYKVNNFLNTDTTINDNTKILLLDGMDEYRHLPGDKSSVSYKIACKLSKLNMKTIIISCREMDWYGEDDHNNLRDTLNKPVAVYRILPLDDEKKEEFYNFFKKDSNGTNYKHFFSKYNPYGFLENPQMLRMIINLESQNNSIESKQDLFKYFIMQCKEQNKTNKRNKNPMDNDTFIKLVGYIATFYIFSKVENLDEDFIDKISNDHHEFPYKDIQYVLQNSSLFNQKTGFTHRTHAEFSSAYFLHNFKFDANTPIHRIKNFFGIKSCIPSEFRGTYSWFCSLSKNEELIDIDPYYQAINGDCSIFDNSLKKKMVVSVRKYANRQNPFFYNWTHSNCLEGFYDSKLDDFLINELDKGRYLDNNYTWFLIDILISATNLSEKIIDNIEKKLFDKNFPAVYKGDLANIFLNHPHILRKLADRLILDHTHKDYLPDETDTIKESILTILYPTIITPLEIIPWILNYTSELIGCRYLLKTPYEDSFELIKKIYKERDNHMHLYSLSFNIKWFINDYILKTIRKFEVNLNENEIYKIIKKIYSCCPLYYSQKYSPSLSSMMNTQKDQTYFKKLQTLLYTQYVKEKIAESSNANHLRLSLYEFRNWPIEIEPTCKVNVLMDSIDLSKKKSDLNKSLFFYALSHITIKNLDDRDCEKYKKIAQSIDLSSDFEEWLKPKHEKEKEENKAQKKRHTEIEKNETNIKQILEENSPIIPFSVLNYISDFYFIPSTPIDDWLSKEMAKKLTDHLQRAIFNPLLNEPLLTIDSLAKNSPKAQRKIDHVYYVSACKNNFNRELFHKLKKCQSEKFIQYLYINFVQNCDANIVDTIKGNLLEFVDDTFAQNTLKQYFQLLVTTHLPDLCIIYSDYIDKIEFDTELLTRLINISANNNEKLIPYIILNNLLNELNIRLDANYLDAILNKIKPLVFKPNHILSEKHCELIQKNLRLTLLLKTFNSNNKADFTEEMAVDLYTIFDFFSESTPRFDSLESDQKIRIIDYLITQFPSHESLVAQNGFQSDRDRCVRFLSSKALSLLDLDGLKKLKTIQNKLKDNELKNTIWPSKIQKQIFELEQQSIDKNYNKYSLEKIKNFLLNNTPRNKRDFFYDVYDKFTELKKEIEGNRINEKELFFENTSPKNEMHCCNVIHILMKYKYNNQLKIIKEKCEGSNRVDLNVTYYSNSNFEVQIECKKDDNKNLKKGIDDQLIKKYLDKKCHYGIYLVFSFQQSESELKNKLEKAIPDDYKERIKILVINCK